jgi:acid phosphatase type 7
MAKERIMKTRCWLGMLAALLMAGSASPALDIWCPHVTSAAGWKTGISIYNPETSPVVVAVERFKSSGSTHGDTLLLLAAPQAWTALDPTELEFEGSAHLTSTSDMDVNLSYQSGDYPGLCQFFLENAAASSWILPNTLVPWMAYTGLAVVNSRQTPVEMELEAWRDGEKLASSHIVLKSREKYSRLSNGIWPGVGYPDFDTIRVLADAPIPGPLLINGNLPDDLHQFSAARPLDANPDGSDGYWAPWVTKTTVASATINWRGENDGLGLVDYATADYFDSHQGFQHTMASVTPGGYQHVELTGLLPGTKYVYRVRPSGNTARFDDRCFRTMPVDGPFTFIVISDTQEGHNYPESLRFRHVAEAIARDQEVLFVLHGGDMGRFDLEASWQDFFQAADSMLSKTAIYPTVGNHEYHSHDDSSGPPTNADQFRWAFDMPMHYSFVCAGIRFIILDSPDPGNALEDDPQTSLSLARSQAPWLQDLLGHTALGTFTIHHHPIWAAGSATMNSDLQPWEDLFHAYSISADFSGHVHNYEYHRVAGIPYFIVGISGGPCADLTGPYPPGYIHGETLQLGYLRVRVDPARNTATAEEVVVGVVEASDSGEVPHIFDPPIVAHSVTFPLRPSP